MSVFITRLACFACFIVYKLQSEMFMYLLVSLRLTQAIRGI